MLAHSYDISFSYCNILAISNRHAVELAKPHAVSIANRHPVDVSNGHNLELPNAYVIGFCSLTDSHAIKFCNTDAIGVAHRNTLTVAHKLLHTYTFIDCDNDADVFAHSDAISSSIPLTVAVSDGFYDAIAVGQRHTHGCFNRNTAVDIKHDADLVHHPVSSAHALCNAVAQDGVADYNRERERER